MQQRDFVMRMIEQLGVALARLRQLINGKSSEAEIRAEMTAAARAGGVDLEMARVASPDTLAALLSVGGEINPSRCWLTAELLLLDGLEAETAGDVSAAVLSYKKALHLFRLLEPAGTLLPGWPEACDRVEEITGTLGRLRAAQSTESI